jgi:hypothetical protein
MAVSKERWDAALANMNKKLYWKGTVSKIDDFGVFIGEEFIDGVTWSGKWAIMTPRSWAINGLGKLGTGYGQRYRKTPEGWLKVEG